MKSETLQHLQNARYDAIHAQSFYLKIRIAYSQRLLDDAALHNYVMQRYATATITCVWHTKKTWIILKVFNIKDSAYIENK